MDEVKVFYDRRGQTLTVWFGDPEEESVCQETGDEIVLIKNAKGVVIGFEKLNFELPAKRSLRLAFETTTA